MQLGKVTLHTVHPLVDLTERKRGGGGGGGYRGREGGAWLTIPQTFSPKDQKEPLLVLSLPACLPYLSLLDTGGLQEAPTIRKEDFQEGWCWRMACICFLVWVGGLVVEQCVWYCVLYSLSAWGIICYLFQTTAHILYVLFFLNNDFIFSSVLYCVCSGSGSVGNRCISNHVFPLTTDEMRFLLDILILGFRWLWSALEKWHKEETTVLFKILTLYRTLYRTNKCCNLIMHSLATS